MTSEQLRAQWLNRMLCALPIEEIFHLRVKGVGLVSVLYCQQAIKFDSIVELGKGIVTTRQSFRIFSN